MTELAPEPTPEPEVPQSDALDAMEALALLAVHDEEGTLLVPGALPFALAAAAVFELRVAGALHVQDGKLRPVGEPVADPRLAPLDTFARSAGGGADIAVTVAEVARREPELVGRVLDRLVERGILSRQQGRVLWVFPVTRYPEKDALPERRLRRAVRQAVKDPKGLDARLSFVMLMVAASGLESEVFFKDERRDFAYRVSAILDDARGRRRSDEDAALLAGAYEAVEAALLSRTVPTVSP
jgi:hypothetical protein